MKYIIIHSHFYQPPRENPCLSAILRQNEVKPYHDWNERITDECYRPNYASRVLDDRGRILDIVNNYEYMSFNVGPTLLGYLKEKASDVYEKIIYADKESCKRLGGYGNAIAQVYNHIILPLASYRDKLTEIKWGIEDFYYHFGRLPDGMWLSETAINSETIDALYISGIRFTILSPYQAKAVFSKAENKWIDVSDGSIDYSKPYVVFGRRGHIFVFFYNPYISGDISFGSLLQNGDVLFGRMMEAIENKEMVNVAVDGETFGHHKPFGDMCLAYFFRRLFREREDVQPVNYSYYLNIYPADEIEEVRLKEGKGGRGTSWSCKHGVERWRDDCGCQTGGKPEWQQKWRFFMRKAIDELKSGIDYLYQKNINHKYPWQIRDDFIKYLLYYKNEKDGFRKFISFYSIDLEKEDIVRRLLYAEYFILLAYTSCGWFFADISGIEAQQNLLYAYMSYSLLKDVFSEIEEYYRKFIENLKLAKSNIETFGDGYGVLSFVIRKHWYSLRRLLAIFLFYKELSPYVSPKLYPSFWVELYEENKAILHSEFFGKKSYEYKILRDKDELKIWVSGTSFSFADLPVDDREELFAKLKKEFFEEIEDNIKIFFERYKSIIESAVSYDVDLPWHFKGVVAGCIDYFISKELPDSFLDFDIYGNEFLKEALKLKKIFGLNMDLSLLRTKISYSIMELFKKLKQTFRYEFVKKIENLIDFANEWGISLSYRNYIENLYFLILKDYVVRDVDKLDNEFLLGLYRLGEKLNFSYDVISFLKG